MKKRRLTPSTYVIVTRAVEAGVRYGLRRAYKHRDDPPSEDLIETLADQIETAVMNELCEVIQWDD